MNISRKWYWSHAAAVIAFFILLNFIKVQDIVARAFGYTGSVPRFALDQRLHGYTSALAFQVTMAYGEAGRRAYALLLLTCDLFFPFLYGSFLFLSIRAASGRAAILMVWANRLAAFGFVRTGCDWLENISFLILLNMYPGQSTVVARLASLFTGSKFFAFAISLIVLAVLGISILIETLRERRYQLVSICFEFRIVLSFVTRVCRQNRRLFRRSEDDFDSPARLSPKV